MCLGAAAGRGCCALTGSNSHGVTGCQLSWTQAIHFYGLMLAVTKREEDCECQGWMRRRASNPRACTALPGWPRKATYSGNGAPLLTLLFPAEPQFSYLELSPLGVIPAIPAPTHEYQEGWGDVFSIQKQFEFVWFSVFCWRWSTGCRKDTKALGSPSVQDGGQVWGSDTLSKKPLFHYMCPNLESVWLNWQVCEHRMICYWRITIWELEGKKKLDQCLCTGEVHRLWERDGFCMLF